MNTLRNRKKYVQHVLAAIFLPLHYGRSAYSGLPMKWSVMPFLTSPHASSRPPPDFLRMVFLPPSTLDVVIP